MKVGFMQFSPLFGRKEKNVERVINPLRGAKADLLVLPELFSTGYLFLNEEELRRSAESIPDGPTVSRFLKLAKKENTNLVFGIAERADDRLFNSSVLVTPKGECFVYRKLHLFDREKHLFSPGDKELEVFDIGEAKVGMMICFDWIFPEVARILALKGADIICHPSNLILPYCQDAMITRCIENRVFAITSNRTGREKRGNQELIFTGNSQIVDPKGRILAKANAKEEEVCVIEIDPSWAEDKMVTPNNHILEDRRTDFYKRGNLC
ncbi:MAG: nitrilase-related carbon-nitrogen hydrolase [Candidatus Zixiibacteriota bacterium]